jgi:hypothetical protein
MVNINGIQKQHHRNELRIIITAEIEVFRDFSQSDCNQNKKYDRNARYREFSEKANRGSGAGAGFMIAGE